MNIILMARIFGPKQRQLLYSITPTIVPMSVNALVARGRFCTIRNMVATI
jgi:hypothetical protein